MTPPALVLDANVLMRAVLGRRVSALLQAYSPGVNFLAPDVAFADVQKHLAAVLAKRNAAHAWAAGMDKLAALRGVVQTIEQSEYLPLKTAALARIEPRDPDDWPVLACALLLNCPIWTEDRDFFGTGVATWTTATVELYLAEGGTA